MERLPIQIDKGKLAIFLHDKHCRYYNHTDGCGWNYEIRDGIHDWTRRAHLNWLAKVDKYLEEAYILIEMSIAEEPKWKSERWVWNKAQQKIRYENAPEQTNWVANVQNPDIAEHIVNLHNNWRADNF